MRGQDVRKHITSVKDTVKITKAMQMISLAKMHKLEPKIGAHRDYLKAVTDALYNLLANVEECAHPYLTPQQKGSSLYIFVAGDKGLCGDYNSKVSTFLDELIKDDGNAKVLTVGEMASEHIFARGLAADTRFDTIVAAPKVDDAYLLTECITQQYKSGEIGKVLLVYTYAQSLNEPQPIAKQLLPIAFDSERLDSIKRKSYIEYAPDEKTALDYILTEYLIASVYSSLLEASYFEYYKRMTAMQQASTNGEDMIARLTLQYNKQRQEGITSELLDSASSKKEER